MDWSQTLRQTGRAVRDGIVRAAQAVRGAGRTAPSAIGEPGAANTAATPAVRWRPWVWAATAGLAALVLAFPLMAWTVHTIDDDPGFTLDGESLKPGQARSVAIAVALIRREVDDHGWTPNDPWFWPTALLDNMPNYQTGVMQALARFSFELNDQLGRVRGSSQADADLQNAAGLLQTAPTRWVWNADSVLPTATAESQYRSAARALATYNDRLAAGSAVFDTRADNLLATLDRIAADLGSSSAEIEQHVRGSSGFFLDSRADDLFYRTKGKLYAYLLILRELERDFGSVVEQRRLKGTPEQPGAWDNMIRSFEEAVALRPWIILDASPDALAFPNHLSAQGFYLLRARTQLREASSILAN